MSRRHVPLACLCVCAALFGVAGGVPAARAAQKPFSLPFALPLGPGTWYLIQGYGNTLTAFTQRNSIYPAGQGMHFGVDFAAPCGTPVVAVGDGVVSEVDALEHGSPPHNLMIDHANGYSSFYGHLLQRPNLRRGQAVKRGDVVALSGDWFATCHSSPHLHLEIRNHSHSVAYNPVPLIDADWDTLALTSPPASVFARDLDNPRRWQYLDDQPDIHMGGPMLNEYADPWPLEWR